MLVDRYDGRPLTPEQERLIEAAKAGDLDGVRRALAEGADADALGFHFAGAVQSALQAGDATWLKRTITRALRAPEPPHPNEARARAFALELGKIDHTSVSRGEDQRAFAWGFHVGPTPAAGGDALAIGASARSGVMVLLPGKPEQAVVTTAIAKTLSRAPDLWAGAAIAPPTAYYDDDIELGESPSTYKIIDPRSTFPDLAREDTLLAKPMPGMTIAMLARWEILVNRVDRLGKLHELNAPDVVVEEERRRIGEGFVDLLDVGWKPRLKPLPDHVANAVASLLEDKGPKSPPRPKKPRRPKKGR